jgi:hypothetical protein
MYVVQFHLHQTNRSLPFPFSVCRKQMKVLFPVSSIFHLQNSINVETWTWRLGDGAIEMETSKRKREPRLFSLICLSFIHHRKWKFVICPFVDEEINGSYRFSNELNGLAPLCQLPNTICVKQTSDCQFPIAT